MTDNRKHFLWAAFLAAWAVGVGMGTWLDSGKSRVRKLEAEGEKLRNEARTEKAHFAEAMIALKEECKEDAADNEELIRELNGAIDGRDSQIAALTERINALGNFRGAIGVLTDEPESPAEDDEALRGVRDLLDEKMPAAEKKRMARLSERVEQLRVEKIKLQIELRTKGNWYAKALSDAGAKLVKRDAEIERLKKVIADLESKERNRTT